MESNIEQLANQTKQQTLDCPPIKDREGPAYLIMLFVNFIVGLIVLIYTLKAHKLYLQAIAADTEDVKSFLYAKAVKKDKVAQAWIIVALALIGLFVTIIAIVVIVNR